MHICYSDTPERGSGFPVKYDQLNATKHYLTHYFNFRYLRFIESNSENRMEKFQAAKELQICERKLAYWQKHPNYNIEQVKQGREKIDAEWNSKRSK